MQPRSFISIANPVVLPCGSACAITPQPFARNIPGNISSAMARFLPWSLKSSTSFSTAAIPITALPASVAPTAAWNTCRRSVARCAASVPLANNGVPGEVLTLHTFGDYLNFRPHIHAIATDGLFDRTGAFTPLPDAQLRHLDLWEGPARPTERAPPPLLELGCVREPFYNDLPFGPDTYAE